MVGRTDAVPVTSLRPVSRAVVCCWSRAASLARSEARRKAELDAVVEAERVSPAQTVRAALRSSLPEGFHVNPTSRATRS